MQPQCKGNILYCRCANPITAVTTESLSCRWSNGMWPVVHCSSFSDSIYFLTNTNKDLGTPCADMYAVVRLVSIAHCTHPLHRVYPTVTEKRYQLWFLRATAGTAIARLSHRNSVRLSVRPSVTRVDQAKTVQARNVHAVQARIIKSYPSAAPKTLVSGFVTLFQKFHRGHPNRGP